MRIISLTVMITTFLMVCISNAYSQEMGEIERITFGKTLPINCGSTPQEAWNMRKGHGEQYYKFRSMNMSQFHKKIQSGPWSGPLYGKVCFLRACEGGHAEACDDLLNNSIFYELQELRGTKYDMQEQVKVVDAFVAIQERACNAGFGDVCNNLADFWYKDYGSFEEWCDYVLGAEEGEPCAKKLKTKYYDKLDKNVHFYNKPSIMRDYYLKGCHAEHAKSCHEYAYYGFDDTSRTGAIKSAYYNDLACKYGKENADKSSDVYCQNAEYDRRTVKKHEAKLRAERERMARERERSRERRRDFNNIFAMFIGGVSAAIETDRRSRLSPTQRAAEDRQRMLNNMTPQQRSEVYAIETKHRNEMNAIETKHRDARNNASSSTNTSNNASETSSASNTHSSSGSSGTNFKLSCGVEKHKRKPGSLCEYDPDWNKEERERVALENAISLCNSRNASSYSGTSWSWQQGKGCVSPTRPPVSRQPWVTKPPCKTKGCVINN